MIPDGYDAFLSSCTFNKGYAGVITYTKLSNLPKIAFTTLKEYVNHFLLVLLIQIIYQMKSRLLIHMNHHFLIKQMKKVV